MTDTTAVIIETVEVVRIESTEVGLQGPMGIQGPTGPAGATDHGVLTGLADDDHSQYHTDARGDARYAVIAHNHTGTYEPADATILKQADVDDAPVNGVTTAPVSSNWAYDHAALTTAHGISTFGATLVDDADVGTARSTLGLGTAATTAATDYATAAHNHSGTYLAVGTDAADLTSGAATDNYVLTADGSGGAAWEVPTSSFGDITGSSLTVSGSDEPTYGSELLTSAGWTVNAGWTESPDDTFTHTGGGGTGTLTHSATIVNGTRYQITYTITGRTAGTIAIAIGGFIVYSISGSGTVGPTTSSTSAFTVMPTTDFNGTCVFSLKTIFAVSTPRLIVKDAGGTRTLEIRTRSNQNLFFGVDSGGFCTTGLQNIGFGTGAQQNLTTGMQNIAFGQYSQLNLTIGSNNISAGYDAQRNLISGIGNIAFGLNTQYSITSGQHNFGVCVNALYGVTTGWTNIGLGHSAGRSITTGSNNIHIGSFAGNAHADGVTALTDPENCIYIGYAVRGKDNNDSDSIVIGANAIGLGANTTVIGSTSTTLSRLYGRIDAACTTEQLRLGYDASYYASFTVSSTGNLTLDSIGGTIYTPDVIENTTSGEGIILKSPDGTRYKITVANGGTLSIAAA